MKTIYSILKQIKRLTRTGTSFSLNIKQNTLNINLKECYSYITMDATQILRNRLRKNTTTGSNLVFITCKYDTYKYKSAKIGEIKINDEVFFIQCIQGREKEIDFIRFLILEFLSIIQNERHSITYNNVLIYNNNV